MKKANPHLPPRESVCQCGFQLVATLHHHQLWNLGEKTIVTKIPDVSAVVGPMFLSSLHHVVPICVSWVENKTFMSKLKYRMFLLRLQSWAECFNTTRRILTSFIHQLLSILTKLLLQEPTILGPPNVST